MDTIVSKGPGQDRQLPGSIFPKDIFPGMARAAKLPDVFSNA